MKRMRTPFVAACIVIAATPAAFAATTPAILTTKANKVPACVTPAHLMAFMKERNKQLPAKLDAIASLYQKHGEELHVRWDYAFYQMLVETNYLKFYAPGGKRGDVSPGQNNFAGLGAIGHRAPGESFASVDLGVQAHLGHVRLYSGDPVANPVAERTKLVTDLILPWAQSLNHPVTFTDLTHKWAPGGHSYSDAIEGTAEFYRKAYCNGVADEAAADATPEPSQDAAANDAVSAVPARKVKVVAIKSPVVSAPAAVAAAEAPDAAASDADVALAGPALKKLVKTATVAPAAKTPTDDEAMAAPDATAEPDTSAGKSAERAPIAETDTAPAVVADLPVKKIVKPEPKRTATVTDVVSAVTGKVVSTVKTIAAKLPSATAATGTTAAAPARTPLEDAVAQLDGTDTATVANPVTETAAANEDTQGDGGATEVAAAPVKKAVPVVVAKIVKPLLVAASADAIPALNAKPQADAGSISVATETTTENASSKTQLASLTVPTNPAPGKSCKVFTASYGGGVSLLIQSPDGDRTRFTALTVNETKADAQAKAFINVYAKGGQKIASFGTQNEALTKAFQLCPEG
jgi:Mannosyl-glycoprotein endo-beta-N-acetylglucosaminidase